MQKVTIPYERLAKKARIFEILKSDPTLSARQLQARAEEFGIVLTMIASYRALRGFKSSGGRLENSETRCLRVVSEILQEGARGEHMTAGEIKRRASRRSVSIHPATIYRVLEKLRASGLIIAIVGQKQKLYEWRRDGEQHGYLSCVTCARTVEFRQDQLEQIGKQLCMQAGYQFLYVDFVLRSRCQACRAL